MNTHSETQHFQERLTFSVNLYSQLASRRHDKRNRPLHLLERTLVFDVSEERKKEGNRLSGARLGHTDHITTGHDSWDGLGLDGCRCCVVESFDNIEAK